MPVDHAVIVTSVVLDPAFAKNANPDLVTLPERFRYLVVRVACQVNRRHDRDVATKTIHIDSYGSIKLVVEYDGEWTVKKITFNPSKLVFGHNGRVTTEDEFHRALSILLQLVSPLLEKQEDFIHIVPGLSPQSRAWWSSIEIPFQTEDPDGVLLHAFSNAKHPKIHKSPLPCRGESVKFVSANGELVINIYRKDIQVRAKTGKFNVPESAAVLRVEVRLRGEKLREILAGNGTTKQIRDDVRIVRFGSSDLVGAHYGIVSVFQGLYSRPVGTDNAPVNCKLGRIMGWVSRRTDLTLEDQLHYHKERFGLSANQKNSLRTAAFNELSMIKDLRAEDIFSAEAWRNQPVVTIPKLEVMTMARHRCIDIHPLVATAYGSASNALI